MSHAAVIAPVYVHASVKRRKNVWYTQKDGNWTDPSIWESNAIKRWNYPGQNIAAPIFPQVGDDVYISHSVTYNLTSNIQVNNLYIAGSLLFDSTDFRTLQINGDIQVVGTLNMTSAGRTTLLLYGVNNYVVNFTSGINSTVEYTRNGDQNIMTLSYRNLTISGFRGTKYLTGNTTLSGNFSISPGTDLINFCAFDALNYDFTVTGSTSFNDFHSFSKTGGGNILFIGSWSTNGGPAAKFNLSGNPTFEFRGGWNGVAYYGTGYSFNSGSGTWKFSTNNQTLNSGCYLPGTFTCNILVSGAITVTNSCQVNLSGGIRMGAGTSIDGDNTSSTWTNQSYLYFFGTTMPMATLGVFNYNTHASSVLAFCYAGNFTVPYTTFQGLVLGNSGIKNLSGNTTVATTFKLGGIITNSTTIECSTYNFTVTGGSSISGTFSKTGSGALLFIGNFVMVDNSGALGCNIDFSGNPTVEFRGGATFIVYGGGTINMGSNAWTFTTNNQTIGSGSYFPAGFNGNFLISGAITLTNSIPSPGLVITGTINGNNAASTLDNRGLLSYRNATQPMATGKLYCNQATNTWLYDLAGNQDITVPSDPTPGYKNLTLATSGAKRLLGNVSVKGIYTLSSPATLNSNGFSLTNP